MLVEVSRPVQYVPPFLVNQIHLNCQELQKVPFSSILLIDLELGFSLVTVLVTVGSVQAERGVDLNVNEGYVAPLLVIYTQFILQSHL